MLFYGNSKTLPIDIKAPLSFILLIPVTPDIVEREGCGMQNIVMADNIAVAAYLLPRRPLHTGAGWKPKGMHDCSMLGYHNSQNGNYGVLKVSTPEGPYKVSKNTIRLILPRTFSEDRKNAQRINRSNIRKAPCYLNITRRFAIVNGVGYSTNRGGWLYVFLSIMLNISYQACALSCFSTGTS